MDDAARRRLLAAGVAVGFAAAGAGIGWWRLRPQAARDDAGAALLGATLNDPAGQPVPIGRFAGKPLVVNFWATWCAPCVKEMPELARLRDAFAPRGIETLGVAIDAPSAVREFVARRPVSYPLVVGGLGGTELARAFGNDSGALPFTVLLDAAGRIAWRHLGVVDPRALADACERVLRA